MPVSLTVALVMRWLRDGSADAIIAAIRTEAAARQKLAAAALAGHAYAAHPNGHHVWISCRSTGAGRNSPRMCSARASPS